MELIEKKKLFGLYGLLHAIGQDRGLQGDELDAFISNADRMAGTDADDLHDVAYKLAQIGAIDEDTLNLYLDAADYVVVD